MENDWRVQRDQIIGLGENSFKKSYYPELQMKISELEASYKNLQKREALLNATQRLTKVGGWEYDIKSGKSFWTDELYRIHEIPFDSGLDLFTESSKCFRPEDRQVIQEAFRRACELGKAYDLEFPFTTFKGKHLWIRTTAQPVYEENSMVRIAGIFMDITDQKRTEEKIRKLNQELEQRVADRTAQLEAANRELEAFAYSVSHDLRAPLRHINGFMNLFIEQTNGVLNEKSQNYLNKIADASKRMGTLIEDLLSFSRMGRLEMSAQHVNLNILVQEIIQELLPDFSERNIHWRISDLPLITGDRSLLRAAMVNLISNAIKFTKQRAQAEIEIGYYTKGSEIVVFVRDNGVGFDPNYANKLFKVFQRLHSNDDFEGTGIGLANVRRIIERHGGKTWAEGQIGNGAIFYFSLPS